MVCGRGSCGNWGEDEGEGIITQVESVGVSVGVVGIGVRVRVRVRAYTNAKWRVYLFPFDGVEVSAFDGVWMSAC